MDRESTLYLTEKGVKVVSIDSWSWNRRLPFLAREFILIFMPQIYILFVSILFSPLDPMFIYLMY